ncbi:MAG: PliI family lysozyme inhibitor of I-type lysozyme [Ginsengibacter sp.]
MLIRTFSITLLSALILIGCKESVTNKNLETQTEDSVTHSTKDQRPFQKMLSSQKISYEVSAMGSGSIQQLIVQPTGLTEINDKITLEIDGQVINAEIADLNSDGYPELLVYTTSAGSGSYGNVIGFSPNNGKSLSQIYFPNVADNSKANSGYMGHDEFGVVDNTLVQKFPIYKKGDINSNPRGGIRQIQYKLKDGEASRKFVLDKIVELSNKE